MLKVDIGIPNESATQQLVDVEVVIGTPRDDSLGAVASWAGGRVLQGLGGDDGFGSTEGAPSGLRFVGGAGSDSAFIGSEKATFVGGQGDDWFQCYTGCTAKLGPGNDGASNTYFTGSGPIVVYLGPGDDKVYAKQSTRIVAYGGPGDDLFGGGPFDDVFKGGGGSDLFYGDGGSDKCYGGPGNDRLGPDATCAVKSSIEQR